MKLLARIVLLTCLFCCTAASATEDKERQPGVTETPSGKCAPCCHKSRSGQTLELTSTDIEQRTIRKKIREGVRVTLLPKQSQDERINLVVQLNYGDESSWSEYAYAEIAFSELVLKGTRSLDRTGFEDALEKIDAEANAFRTRSGLRITARVAPEYYPELLNLVFTALKEPRMDPRELERFQQEAAILNVSSFHVSFMASILAKEAELSHAYSTGHPHAPVSDAEAIAAIRELKLTDIEAFDKKFVNGARLHIGLVGNFRPDLVTRQLTNLLTEWQASPTSYTRVPDRISTRAGSIEHIDVPGSAAAVVGTLPLAISQTSADFGALSLANHALVHALDPRVRTQSCTVESVHGSLEASPVELAGLVLTAVHTTPEKLKAMHLVLREEIQRLYDNGLSEAQLARARISWMEEHAARLNHGLALATVLTEHSELDRTMQHVIELEDRVASLTVEQVNLVIRKHLMPAKWNTVLYGDSKKLASE
jgi:zinc protease